MRKMINVWKGLSIDFWGTGTSIFTDISTYKYSGKKMNILYYVYLGIRYNLNILVEKTTFEFMLR